MFKKHTAKRSPNILFVIFRLILSLTMFTVLILGAYSAYKHFSGLDPLKLDPQSLVKSIFGSKTPDEFLAVLGSIKINNPIKDAEKKVQSANLDSSLARIASSAYIFRFMLVADSHSDNQNLKQAISKVKASYSDIEFIIGLGDYTDIGTTQELKAAKTEFDSTALRYFLVSGDHDLWESRDKNLDPHTNFRQVFGPSYQSFTYKGFNFLLLSNSDNYIGISKEQSDWIEGELGKAKESLGTFVFFHEPLYHPSSDHYMGKVEKSLKTQAEALTFELKSAGVKKVFAGDTHYFSEYEEPVTKLPMVTVGALVTDRNPQLPRFAVVSVYEDGSTKVEDVELK